MVLSAPALRDLRRLDPPIRERIERALLDFAADPARPGAARPLVGEGGERRLRVGGWRVRLTLDVPERALLVLRVLPRGRAYRD